MPELSIVIPTLNRLETLAPCLDSIRRCTSASHEILVYANACDRAMARYLDSVPDVRSIRDPGNRFFTKAVNIAIARSCGRYIFLLNDDTLVLRSDWFPFYRRHLELDPRIAVVGPYWKNIDELPYGWIEPYATLYRRDVFERFGGLPCFDSSFNLWWSDIYHAYRLMNAGCYLLPLARPVVDAVIHHRRVGESGDTVLSLKPSMPEECFNFHGKATMYRRLGIERDSDLAGYYGGLVWGADHVLETGRDGRAVPFAPDHALPHGPPAPSRMSGRASG
jgi:GT2 family glycosyltransferase